jgi:squalene-hopene/tetraprenyl-beta-curcumene cyclase
MNESRIQDTYRRAVEALLAERNREGIWRGRLSSSPLATATAVFALYQVDSRGYQPFIEKGLQWLADVQNSDGGWGDTDGADPSNLSTTLLCRSAFYGCRAIGVYELTLNKAERWIGGKVGSLEPKSIVKAVYAAYGKDRTFAVPILTMCAMAGCLGEDGWRYVEPLPFELAVLPRKPFRWLNLSVVSYALPALIAIGQVKFYFDPPKNPLVRFIRGLVRNKTLSFLRCLQPANGGFLEAAPLTAFVTMSLAACSTAAPGCETDSRVDGLPLNDVIQKGADFLIRSIRPDGSWPIDTDLATWLTTLSINAFGEDAASVLSAEQRKKICDWLLRQQFQTVHPFTGAAPGGWGWTDKPGAVPDADDTAGALIALYHLDKDNPVVGTAAKKGAVWLLNLQNANGGIPTFCRGWGKLPFDRSCPDITAHAIQAWMCWRDAFDPAMKKRIDRAVKKALLYLYSRQHKAGFWLPLWFGNPAARGQTNPIYGTARVLLSLIKFSGPEALLVQKMLQAGADWFLSTQKQDGSWSADGVCESSIEETALAVGALAALGLTYKELPASSVLKQCVENGILWLTRYEGNKSCAIGLYFAKLWYYESLYKSIFRFLAFRHIQGYF